MTKNEKIKCNSIIHAAASLSALAATPLAQFPGSDSAVIIPIQVGMIISLGAVFGITLDNSTAKAALATAAATQIGRAISQTLVGWIPLYGNIINAATAFGITENIGWILANDFSRGSYYLVSS